MRKWTQTGRSLRHGSAALRITLALALIVCAVGVDSTGDSIASIRDTFGKPAPKALLDVLGPLPQHGALVFIPAQDASAPEPKRLELEVSEAPALDGVMRAIALNDTKSKTAENVRVVPPWGLRDALGLARYADAKTQHLGMFISADGIVRRAEFLARADDVPVMNARFQEWRRGQAIYAASCSRCHGKDGADTSYPLIKTLNGIAARYDEHRIIEETAATAIVNVRGFSEEDQFALAVYVAGL